MKVPKLKGGKKNFGSSGGSKIGGGGNPKSGPLVASFAKDALITKR